MASTLYVVYRGKKQDGAYWKMEGTWMNCRHMCGGVKMANEKRLYTAHEVAVIIANLLGDDCACNFNSIDEWLPFKCELQDACPNPDGVACWEQYLKHMEET